VLSRKNPSSGILESCLRRYRQPPVSASHWARPASHARLPSSRPQHMPYAPLMTDRQPTDPLKPTPEELRRHRRVLRTVAAITGAGMGLGLLVVTGIAALIVRYWH
jgi:hypothetical protein